MRKIAANYIFLPGFPLMKNGYVIVEEGQVVRVVDTGEVIREIQALEFYGGIIVAGYVKGFTERLRNNDDLLLFLTQLYKEYGSAYTGLCVVEGADLVAFKWKSFTRIRPL